MIASQVRAWLISKGVSTEPSGEALSDFEKASFRGLACFHFCVESERIEDMLMYPDTMPSALYREVMEAAGEVVQTEEVAPPMVPNDPTVVIVDEPPMDVSGAQEGDASEEAAPSDEGTSEEAVSEESPAETPAEESAQEPIQEPPQEPAPESTDESSEPQPEGDTPEEDSTEEPEDTEK